jgi:HTH-type transcriptional regulator / antitoxin HipB
MQYKIEEDHQVPVEQIVRNSKQLGVAIRRHRRSAGLSQAQLGAKTNLRQATISALERGEPGTELRTVIDVITALGIEIVVRDRSQPAGKIEDLF